MLITKLRVIEIAVDEWYKQYQKTRRNEIKKKKLSSFDDFFFFICIFVPELQAYLSCNSRKPMGMYINKGNNDFRDIVAHEYVDKSSLIPLINAMLNSENGLSNVYVSPDR